MERSRLIVNFDSSGDKLLSTENVVACGETFDILFRDVTLSGTVRVAFWDYETLLWRSEGSASQGDGGSVLEGLVADTKELADVFRGGSGFFAARLTVGEQVGGDEWRDYGIAYVRLYRGTNPSENPEPARPDVYPTEEELAKWLEEAGVIAGNVTEGAAQAGSAAEAAKQSAAAAQQSASAAGEASLSATKAAQNAETYRGNAQAAAQVAQQARDNAQLQQQQATQQAANARSSATEAKNAKTRAQWAQEDAEKARDAAKLAADNAAESENAARQFSQEAANAATGATQAWEDVAAFYGDLLEAAGLDANQLESQAAKAAGMEDA